MPPEAKLPHIHLPLLTEALCVFSWLISLSLLPVGWVYLTDPDLPLADYRRFSFCFVIGVVFLWVALSQTAKFIDYYLGARAWAGRYYAFGDVQLRISQTPTGRIVFYLDDVLDALGIRAASDRRAVRNTFAARLQLHGAEEFSYVTKAGLWQYLRTKNDRSAILFMQYLREVPEFRDDRQV